MKFRIASTWDGKPIPPAEHSGIEVRLDSDRVVVDVAAPFFEDPAPPAPAGRLDGLWEYEVVELFLLGADERYLEIELGPHGHYLALSLAGRRRITDDRLSMEYAAVIAADRWSGRAILPCSYLPPAVARGNAFAIHGVGKRRRYLAAVACGGTEPDFHRLDDFPEIELRT